MDSKKGLGFEKGSWIRKGSWFERGLVIAVRIAEGGSKGGGPGGAGPPPGKKSQISEGRLPPEDVSVWLEN